MDIDVDMKAVATTNITNSNTNTTSTPMEISKSSSITDLTLGIQSKQLQETIKDSDSGIENMEMSENPSPVTVSAPTKLTSATIVTVTVAAPKKTLEEELEIILSKTLNATWNEYCVGSMICPQSATFLEHYPEKRFDFDTIISDVLMECVMKLYNDDASGAAGDSIDLDMNSITSYSTPKKIKSDDTEVQEILANAEAAAAGENCTLPQAASLDDEQPSTSRAAAGEFGQTICIIDGFENILHKCIIYILQLCLTTQLNYNI